MDLTAVGIVLGATLSAAYTACRIWRRHALSISGIFLMSLAGFSMPVGAALIRAAFAGDPQHLPEYWREYLPAAGSVAIGLSLQYVITVFRSLFANDTTAAPVNDRAGATDSKGGTA